MNEALIRLLLLAQIAATLFMTGVIWFVQIVHYPLFGSVGQAVFRHYEQRHTALTTWVVAPPMLIEGGTAFLLLWLRPAGISPGVLWAGAALVLVLWLATALVQVPCHRVLAEEFNEVVHQRLVWTNWIRTVAWSLRGLLVLWMAWALLAT